MDKTDAVYENYADYYDLFYAEKDYEEECDFVDKIFTKYAKTKVETVLEMGCGTGGHTLPLSRRGYRMTGIDRSQRMLRIAKAKCPASDDGFTIPTLRRGEICGLNLNQTYDAVIAMFAVMGYMNSNAQLSAAFMAARKHLMKGGLFVFDVWFGPGVLSDKPTDACKIIQNEAERIVRFTRSTVNLMDQTVDVRYKLLKLQGERVAAEIDETHSLRFLFPCEIGHYLKEAGFSLIRLCPFLGLDDKLSERDWKMTVIGRAE